MAVFKLGVGNTHAHTDGKEKHGLCAIFCFGHSGDFQIIFEMEKKDQVVVEWRKSLIILIKGGFVDGTTKIISKGGRTRQAVVLRSSTGV